MYSNRKRSFKTLILITIFFSGFTSARAQLLPTLGGQRAGTATVQFLKIGVGARAVGMGESFVAVANDATALYWNPAGIVQFDRNEITLSHIDWPVDIKHEFIGYVHHLNDANAIGISATSLHTDDMPETTEFQPFGTGRYFNFGDIAVTLTYARKMTDMFSFGASIKYIEETLAELKMRGAMIDFGTFYWTGYGSTRFAVSVTNFGPQLKPSGSFTKRDGVKVSDFQSFSPPTIFKVGFAMEVLDRPNHRLTTTIQLNHPNDNSENLNFGAEYWRQKILAFRGGYKANVDEESFSLGLGLALPLKWVALSLDYAYSDFGRLGNASRFSLNLKF